MSVPWRLARSDERGRHLVAATHINLGQLILSQTPYASSQYDVQLKLRCDQTQAEDCSLHRCSGCRVVR